MEGRWQWADVPVRLQDRLQADLHGELTGFTSATAGYSPALAGVAELPGGRHVFVKGIPRQRHPGLAASLDREIAINLAIAASDPPAPAFLGHGDEAGWTVGVWDAVAGHSPGRPWTERQLHGVAATLLRVRGLPTTAVPRADQVYRHWFGGWARLDDLEPRVNEATPVDPVESWWRSRLPHLRTLEQQSLDVVRGRAFVHNDVRSDNLLTTTAGPPVLVDWAHCCAGADWLDAAILSISVAAEGGPSPEDVLDLLGVAVPAHVQSSFVAGWAGYLVQASRLPPTPQTAGLRQHQHRKAVAAVRWLSRLIP